MRAARRPWLRARRRTHEDGLFDTGMVEDGVQAPEALDALVDRGPGVFLVGDVAGRGGRLATLDFDEAGGPTQPVLGRGDEGDLRADPGGGEDGGAADAGSGAVRGGNGSTGCPAPGASGSACHACSLRRCRRTGADRSARRPNGSSRPSCRSPRNPGPSSTPFHRPHVRRADRAPRPVHPTAGSETVRHQAVEPAPRPGPTPPGEPPVRGRSRRAETRQRWAPCTARRGREHDARRHLPVPAPAPASALRPKPSGRCHPPERLPHPVRHRTLHRRRPGRRPTDRAGWDDLLECAGGPF